MPHRQTGSRAACPHAFGHGLHAFQDRLELFALAQANPDYVIIASETALHATHIETLVRLGYDKAVMVEKPLLATPQALPENCFSGFHVGYNLRFHPVVSRLREHLAPARALMVTAYVGQHLAGWRPGRDYRTTSSASWATGGGGAARRP